MNTFTYAILDVARSTWSDVRARLINSLGEHQFRADYLREDHAGDLIVLGTTALRAVAHCVHDVEASPTGLCRHPPIDAASRTGATVTGPVISLAVPWADPAEWRFNNGR